MIWLIRTQALQILWDSVYILTHALNNFCRPYVRQLFCKKLQTHFSRNVRFIICNIFSQVKVILLSWHLHFRHVSLVSNILITIWRFGNLQEVGLYIFNQLSKTLRGESSFQTFKACVRYFLSNFYFSPNDSPSKTMKNVFSWSKKLFSFSRYSIFAFPSSPLFFPVSYCFRVWFKKNLKVYDVIICLNKNLMTHFFRDLETEIRCYNETYSIDRVLNAEHFYGKIMQKMWTKSWR